MTDEQMAAAFNEWMRVYVEEPEKFERDWQAVREFLSDTNDGVEPSYGQECVKTLQRYHDLLFGRGGTTPAKLSKPPVK